MLLLNTVKLVLIAMNILPYRITHRKVLFMIYLGTLVTHGKFRKKTEFYFTCMLSSVVDMSLSNYTSIFRFRKRFNEKNVKELALSHAFVQQINFFSLQYDRKFYVKLCFRVYVFAYMQAFSMAFSDFNFGISFSIWKGFF